MRESDPIQALTALGLTAIEAEIYISLLKESPATGYRIAQMIGKPTGNTYKASETLSTKGAILVEEVPRRQCRAVPYDEFLSGLERSFQKRTIQAREYLASIPMAIHDDKIYRLNSPDQVMERARTMLDRAHVMAILDIFPRPLEDLIPEVEKCAARGVAVTVKTYDAVAIKGVHTVLDFMADKIIERWPGQWVNVVIDSTEHLLAFLSQDCLSVHQAVWSKSAYLSSTYLGGIHAEITLDEIGVVLEQKGSVEDIRNVFSRFRRREMLDSPGYYELMKAYGIENESSGEEQKS
jgi:sugar-specific transcriptional regulator TrmB